MVNRGQCISMVFMVEIGHSVISDFNVKIRGNVLKWFNRQQYDQGCDVNGLNYFIKNLGWTLRTTIRQRTLVKIYSMNTLRFLFSFTKAPKDQCSRREEFMTYTGARLQG